MDGEIPIDDIIDELKDDPRAIGITEFSSKLKVFCANINFTPQKQEETETIDFNVPTIQSYE